jgi:cellulase/cellobiase CelA1
MALVQLLQVTYPEVQTSGKGRPVAYSTSSDRARSRTNRPKGHIQTKKPIAGEMFLDADWHQAQGERFAMADIKT